MLSPLWKFELHVSSPCITATFPSLVQKGDIDKDVRLRFLYYPPAVFRLFNGFPCLARTSKLARSFQKDVLLMGTKSHIILTLLQLCPKLITLPTIVGALLCCHHFVLSFRHPQLSASKNSGQNSDKNISPKLRLGGYLGC